MVRTYLQAKEIPPAAVSSSSRPSGSTDLPPWTDGKKLHTLEQASSILSEELGDNYSVSRLRRRIKGGLLGEAGAVWVFDGSYKINIKNFLDWRVAHPDERKLAPKRRR